MYIFIYIDTYIYREREREAVTSLLGRQNRKIVPGDRIVAIGGVKVDTARLDDVGELLLGAAGSQVCYSRTVSGCL